MGAILSGVKSNITCSYSKVVNEKETKNSKLSQKLQLKNTFFPFNGWESLPKERQVCADNGKKWMMEHMKGSYGLMETDDGRKIETMYIPHENATNKVAILHHNNGMTLGMMEFYAEYFNTLGFNVLLCTMGGYPGSEGDTSETTCYFDVKAMYDAAQTVQRDQPDGQNNDKILFVGVSMGGALAAIGGSEFPGTHVLANVPFASVEDVASSYLRWVPKIMVNGLVDSVFPTGIKAGAYITDGFNILEKVKRIEGGYFAVQAGKDTMIPADSGKKLANSYAISHQKKPEDHYAVMEGKTHNDNFLKLGNREFDKPVRLRVERFLASVGLIDIREEDKFEIAKLGAKV